MGNRNEVASKSPLVEEHPCKRKRDCTLDSSTRSSRSEIPQNKCGRATVVQESKDDTQSRILAALRDLAGKFGTRMTAVRVTRNIVPARLQPLWVMSYHTGRERMIQWISFHCMQIIPFMVVRDNNTPIGIFLRDKRHPNLMRV